MKALVGFTLFSLFVFSCSNEDPSSSQPKFYKLSISVIGQGSYEVVPAKSEYEEGETVTITASAENGWGFRSWEGSIISDKNPLLLTMDRDKTIRAVFDVPFDPDITGKWAGVEYLLTFEIEQPDIFDSSLVGMLFVETINGGTLEYTVSGYNRYPQVKMYCNKPGYYQVEYTGWYANSDKLDGGFEENGIYFECDLLRVLDYPLPEGRLFLSPNKIIE